MLTCIVSYKIILHKYVKIVKWLTVQYPWQSHPLMIIFVGIEMQVGHIQIILSDHVSLKMRNTYIKLDFAVTRPG